MTQTVWTIACAVALLSSCGSDESPPATPSGGGGADSGATGGQAGQPATGGQAGQATGGQAGQGATGGQAGSAAHAGTGGAAGSGGCAELPPPVSVDADGATARLVVQGDPAGSEIGTFDPSIVTASDGTVAMSYTSVNLQRNKLHTRIAVSDDAGVTFTFAAKANAAEEDVTLDADGDPDCPGGTCSHATIVHEVSGLVEDALAPDASARWKLFTHSYVILEPDALDPSTPKLRYEYGQLRMGTAPSADGPWEAPHAILGWRSLSPLSSEAPQLVAEIDELKDCEALTEPSAAIDPVSGAIELAVGCVAPMGQSYGIRVELLRSIDHGATWSYANPLLDVVDAPCVGSERFELNAPHLFATGGQRYLIATPTGSVTYPGGATGVGYRGCLVFRRTDDGVERDAAGAPVVVARIDAGEGVFSGACSHHPRGGYVLSALSFAEPPDIFRMFGPVGTGP